MTVFAEHLAASFQTLSPRLPGADQPAVRAFRESAFRRFRGLGLPATDQEDWKYTGLEALRDTAFRPCEAADGAEVDREMLAALAIPELTLHRIVLVNGRYSAALSTVGALPAGIAVRDLGNVLRNDSARVALHLQRCAAGGAPAFVALNAAFLSAGAVVEIDDEVEVRAPLHLVCITVPGTAPLMSAPRILVTAGRHSRCAVVESYHGVAQTRYLTNALTEIRAAEGATLDHYRIQAEAASGYHFGSLFVAGGADSSVTTTSIAFGAALCRIDIHAALRASGAAVELNGLFVADGNQHVDHHTTVEHHGDATRSRQHYRGILDGSGRGVFNGKVVVHEGTRGVVAEQSNKNLLLSRSAEMDTKPELQIRSDDVRCSHGATVGQLDDNELFYLRSRGIVESTARAMLTSAFAREVVARLAQTAVAEWIETALLGRFA